MPDLSRSRWSIPLRPLISAGFIGLCLLGLLWLAGVGCGPVPAPKPPAPSVPVWTLDVQVNDEHGGVPGAALLILDNENKGRTAVTGPTGEVLIPTLIQSGFTITANADGYEQGSAGITLTHSQQNVTIFLKRKVTVRPGITRAAGPQLLDDAGPRLYLGATFFPALWLYEHDRDRLVAHFEWFARHGIDYVRILLSAGTPTDDFWKQRILDGNPDTLEAVLLLAAQHGLKVKVTVFGDGHLTPDQRADLLETNLRVMQRHQPLVWAVELANELWDVIGRDDAITQEFRAYTKHAQASLPGMLVTLSSPPGDECADQAPYYTGYVSSLRSFHHSRSWNGDGGAWDPMTQPWMGSRFTCPGMAEAREAGEPIGPGSSVQADPPVSVDAASRWRRGALTAATFIAGEGADVLQTGSGVRALSDPADDAKHHRVRPANVYDIPGIDAYAETMRAVRDLLPPTLPTWKRLASDPQSVGLFKVSTFPTNGKGGTVDRVYCATKAPTFACVAINIRGVTTFTAPRAMTVSLHRTLDATLIRSANVGAGQSFTLGPDTPGAVIVGTLR